MARPLRYESAEGNPGDWGVRGRGPGSRLPSWNTGRGVHGSGEAKGIIPEAVGKPTCPQQRVLTLCEGRGLQGPGVTAVRPETGRSRRGQGEAGGNPGGGPKGCWRAIRSHDPRLGAKDQSSPVIAGSRRSASQRSPAGGGLRGRATDWRGMEGNLQPLQSNSEPVAAWEGGSGAPRGKPGGREGNNPDRG